MMQLPTPLTSKCSGLLFHKSVHEEHIYHFEEILTCYTVASAIRTGETDHLSRSDGNRRLELLNHVELVAQRKKTDNTNDG